MRPGYRHRSRTKNLMTKSSVSRMRQGRRELSWVGCCNVMKAWASQPGRESAAWAAWRQHPFRGRSNAVHSQELEGRVVAVVQLEISRGMALVAVVVCDGLRWLAEASGGFDGRWMAAVWRFSRCQDLRHPDLAQISRDSGPEFRRSLQLSGCWAWRGLERVGNKGRDRTCGATPISRASRSPGLHALSMLARRYAMR